MKKNTSMKKRKEPAGEGRKKRDVSPGNASAGGLSLFCTQVGGGEQGPQSGELSAGDTSAGGLSLFCEQTDRRRAAAAERREIFGRCFGRWT